MIQVQGRRVLLRSDLHLAFDHAGKPTRERILGTILPSVRMLLDRGASVVVMGHKKGKTGFQELAGILGKKLNQEIHLLSNPLSEASRQQVQSSEGRSLFLSENLMLSPAEEKNDPAFAKALASLGELFINDAFDASRFPLSSVCKIPGILPAYAGIQLGREIQALKGLKTGAERPLVVVLGGNQIPDKLRIMKHLVSSARNHVDTFLIAGGIAYTFLKSRAVPIGQSIIDNSLEVEAFQAIEKSELVETGVRLPIDHMVAEEYNPTRKLKGVRQNDIPDRWMALDIGPKTLGMFEKTIKKAGTVLWYGPLGAVELESCRKSTLTFGKSLSRTKAFTIVAGEDTQSMMEAGGLLSSFSHWTTSSTSMTEFITGARLPGLEALEADSNLED